MNKNILIGSLIVVVVLGGAWLVYSASTKTDQAPVTQTPPDSDNTPPAPQPSTAGVPTVMTDSGNTFVSNAAALVTGKVTPNGVQTSYWYDYGPTESLGTRSSTQSVGSGWIQLPAPAYITGLSASTRYYFRLSAQNSFGTVTGSTYSFVTNTTPPPSGVVPTVSTLDASDVTRTSASLNGRVNPNGQATSYWYEYGEVNTLGNATALQGAGSGEATISASIQLSDLKPLTKYFFRLNAQNAYGTVTGSIRSFTTPGPSAPGKPSADTTNTTSIGTSTATVNGRVNPNGAATTYWFEYGVDSLLGTLVGSTSHAQAANAGTEQLSVSASLSGLTPNTRYYVRLISQNQYGTDRGDILNFKTKP